MGCDRRCWSSPTARPGLIGAVDQRSTPTACASAAWSIRPQRDAKVSDADRDQVKADFWAIFDIPDHTPPGDAAVAEAAAAPTPSPAHGRVGTREQSRASPTTWTSLTTFLRFPPEHWRRIRHTNLIERTIFGESRPGSRSSAGSQANNRVYRWCGPCSTAPHAAGAAWT